MTYSIFYLLNFLSSFTIQIKKLKFQDHSNHSNGYIFVISKNVSKSLKHRVDRGRSIFTPILRNHSIELETRWSNLKNKRNIFLRDSSPQARRIHERSRVMRIEDRTALLFHAGESERGQSRSLFCVHPRRKAWMEHERPGSS